VSDDVNIRGPVVAVGDSRTVDTSYGGSELRELEVRPERGRRDPVTVTLWGKWARTGEYAEVGMELAAYDLEASEFRGEVGYQTTGDSMVVLEPSVLVTVTDVRKWVDCPRLQYLGKLTSAELSEPLIKGTVVHEVFGDLLRGRELDASVEHRIEESALDIGLAGLDPEGLRESVHEHASAIENWLAQDRLTEADEWRSEQLLVSERYGLRGRADAVRRGSPVELKTGKNTDSDPRFKDKVQAAAYALLLGEDGELPDTGTLLYTKNAALDRSEADGDLSPAKEFSLGPGLCKYVLRARNELAAMESKMAVPTGHESGAICEYCFEQDTCMAVSGRLDQESKAGQVGSSIPAEEQAYFERFSRAIAEERQAVHSEYAKLWEQSAGERADDDRALIDLEPLGRRELDDGRWELRARATDAVSKIREGSLALASDGDPVGGDAELARVERLDEEIVVTTDEPMELCRLDVYPSELSADRLLNALHDTLLTRSPEWKDPLFDRRSPTFEDIEERFVENNDPQDEAVRRAVGTDSFALVHGPPGTGKTYTLASIVAALVERGERVLLSAFTNRAVDNALAALEEQGVPAQLAARDRPLVRYGTDSGVRADMAAYRLERRGDPEALATRLEQAQVVAATTTSCGSSHLSTQEFDVAIVDEAGQLTEPGTLAALNLAERFVLVGDHQQLPPVVRAENRLQQSLFERLVTDHPYAATLLDRQYRMAQCIQSFPSEEFYDGQLRPATADVASRSLADLPNVSPSRLPAHLRGRVTFLDPDGGATGNANPAEAEAVLEVVEAYLGAGVEPGDVGVIAPYRAQVATIRGRLDGSATEGTAEVSVDTVDRFQGSSKEVIVVSFVATGDLEGPIFEDHRRMNVALTRAKRALVLVGDREALSSETTYARMVEWAA
jgi:DNA replication ATP-dependent helicase Dna2